MIAKLECTTPGLSAAIFCNPYVCSSSNCAKCSSNTLCTQCKAGSFLYGDSQNTICVSCASSCISCSSVDKCFLCANSIVENGATCRIDSIGYQIGFSSPNLEIDFAHPLVSGLTKSTLVAKSNLNVEIDTSGWQLPSCTAGKTSCNIVTNNLSESQLPIDLIFEFNAA